MSNVHYFQRYSQKENVATNNTMLLLSRLYNYSPRLFNEVLSDLLEDSTFQSQIKFAQQRAGSRSVPDGSISQDSFKLIIETKLHEAFDLEQLKSHLEAFEGSRSNSEILLLLSPSGINHQIKIDITNEISQFNKARGHNILLVDLTFKDIIISISTVINDRDYEMKEILDDFENYCADSNLIERELMRVVTCGWTIDQNLEHGIYYDRVDRGWSNHSFIGIYKDKCVHAVGRVVNIVEADLDAGSNLIIKSYASMPTTGEKIRIIKMITDTRNKQTWSVDNGHRFFIVNKFVKTSFKKNTLYPIQRTKYFDLKAMFGDREPKTSEELAKLLESETW